MKRSIKRIKADLDQLNDKETLLLQEVSDLDNDLHNTKRSKMDIVEKSLGQPKKPAMYSTIKRKEASLVTRKAELQEVHERLKGKRKALGTELEAAQLSDRSVQLQADYETCSNRTQDTNNHFAKGIRSMDVTRRTVNSVLPAISDCLNDLHSQGKNPSDYFDLEQIRNNVTKLFIHGPDESRIRDYNLKVQDLLARLEAAIDGRRGYSRANRIVQMHGTELQPTDAEQTRQAMEHKRFEHGGMAPLQFNE